MSVAEYTDQIELWVGRILMNSWGTSQSCSVAPEVCNLNDREGGEKVVQQYTVRVTNFVCRSPTLKSKVIIATISVLRMGEAETLPGHTEVRSEQPESSQRLS